MRVACWERKLAESRGCQWHVCLVERGLGLLGSAGEGGRDGTGDTSAVEPHWADCQAAGSSEYLSSREPHSVALVLIL